MIASAVPILLYHSVADDADPDVLRWTVTPRDFSEHMEMLRQEGWQPVTMSTLVGRLDAGLSPGPHGRTVAITFDDGFEDTLTAAAPRMAGMPATMYLTSGYLRDRTGLQVPVPGRMLATTQLTDLEAHGVEVGVHGHTHRALDELSVRQVRDEVLTSRDLVQEALGHRCRGFAYPYGYHDHRVQDAVRAAGFDFALGVKNVHSHRADDRWGMARLTMERGFSAHDLAATLETSNARFAPGSDRLRTRGWRQVRRTRRRLGRVVP